ncbi:MAG: amino acid permease [Rudaea sp.]|uniref:APC family permease n=1 Tax=unclassified Rudaea TaxID=2627037 RepID=UPI0010F82669|nr:MULTISPECIES: amino acid permease [unclassified Rudaea]MBN8887262.1 amino acid permease [Rudaea sp.]
MKDKFQNLAADDAAEHGLARSLGPLQLTLIGIGSVIGAGIFVMTGSAAAFHAGPAVVLSFVIAAIACGFTAFCYAELAATMPMSGSSYSYALLTFGRFAAWCAGWLLLLEYGIAAATVAVGFASYATALLDQLGLHLPATLTTPLFDLERVGDEYRMRFGGGVNVLAAGAMLVVTAVLMRGLSQSVAFNTAVVLLKIAALVVFAAIGVAFVDPGNLIPFVPPAQSNFEFGWPGVLRGASAIFFAYVGFETVSTSAAEARNPQRDLPIGIFSTLTICTLLYMAVAAVMTGIVPYRQLGVADPLALAVDAMRLPALGLAIKSAAVIGLLSVLLTSIYGQSRVFYAMARDRMLPEVFARIDAKTRTPRRGTLYVGLVMSLLAAFMPISVLGDLISLGTALAFAIVCAAVMRLRAVEPERPRPFRVPLGGIMLGGWWIGIVPVLGILFAALMALPLLIDILIRAAHGDVFPATIIGGYFVVGLAIYAFYKPRQS